ncbi:ribosomal protein S13 [Viridothelium virens]|uniref:Ribosomal protein S13 n=1 Tax=Viridothelium virens TaxID=1048519 RepID=A0A6A6HMY0_VIRVR|nr:ribosomal protein S13 [Viridothelium virens]
MVFVFGINFPEKKMVKSALQSFYGIGPNVCTTLMARFSIHPTARLAQINAATIDSLNNELSKMTIDNDLRRQLHDRIRRLRDMGSYRGRRHAMGLPVRGQRTRTQTTTAKKLNKIERRG